jgi:hypothetical protein
MLRSGLKAAILIVSLGLAPGAWAEEPAQPFGGPEVAMNLHMGFLAPLGAVGAEFDVLPFRWLALGVGGGWDFLGMQAAGQIRGRIGLGASPWAATVGGGVAHGHYSAQTCHDHTFLEPPNCDGRKEGDVWWGTAEVGVERDLDAAFGLAWHMRAFGGVKVAANPADVHCTGSCDGGVGPLIYLGLAGGFSLPITARPTRAR